MSEELKIPTIGALPSDPADESQIEAAVAAICGAISTAAATGAVTNTDTLIAYIKQLVTQNGIELDTDTLGALLAGTGGIATMPNAAVPANNVNLFELLRSIWGNQCGTAAGENGIATFPAGAAPANNVSLAEVIRDVWDVLRNGTGGSEPATDKSIIDCLGASLAAFDAAAAPGNTASLAAVLRDAWDVLRNGTGGSEPATNKSIIDCLGATLAAFDVAAAPGNTVSLAAVLRDVWDVVRNGTGGAEPATDKSIMDYLGVSPAFFVPGLGYAVTKTEDIADNTTGDDLFDVTGKVLITLWTQEVATDAIGADCTDYKLRVKTDNIDLCAASDIHSAAVGFISQLCGDAGDSLINTASAKDTADTNGKGLANRVVGKAGGTLTLQSLHTDPNTSTATIVHTLFYMPLEAGAGVAAAT